MNQAMAGAQRLSPTGLMHGHVYSARGGGRRSSAPAPDISQRTHGRSAGFTSEPLLMPSGENS